jgi:hypothetical protein
MQPKENTIPSNLDVPLFEANDYFEFESSLQCRILTTNGRQWWIILFWKTGVGLLAILGLIKAKTRLEVYPDLVFTASMFGNFQFPNIVTGLCGKSNSAVQKRKADLVTHSTTITLKNSCLSTNYLQLLYL